MADHGQLVNSRTYWTWIGPDGKQASGDSPPGGGVAGTLGGLGDKPNTPATQYHEVTYEDGTKILSHFDAGAGEWKQDSYDVDTGIKAQHDQAQKPAAQTKAPETKTFPDGTERQWDPARNDWVIIATKSQGPQQDKPEAGNLPGVNLGPRRPGQKVDLTLIETQANSYIASLNADKSLTPEKRNQMLQAYIAANVKPQVDQATQEANDDQARLTARQQQQDQQARDTAARQNRQEDRLATAADRNAQTAEETLAFNRQKSEYDAGQDAVGNAMKLLPYTVGPTFGAEFSSALNTLGNGGGPINFTPGAVTFQAPDYAAIAEQAAQRAHALYSVPVAGATQGVASAGVPAQPPAALAGLPVQSGPVQPMVKPDQWYR